MTSSLPATARPAARPAPSPLIEVRDLRVATSGGQELVHGVGFDLAPGRTLGIVGESGSGKTLTAIAVAGLEPPGVVTSGGEVVVAGEDVTRRSRAVRRRLLKETFGVVFQNPTVSLNPRLTVGRQLREALPDDVGRGRARAWTRSVELLDRVGIPGATGRLHAYPHELSGGLNQRIAIAIAIARSPRVLIADEATTALDVSVQKQVLDLVDELRRDLDLGVILVSHDMGVVADRSDDVLVLRGGRAVEQGPTVDVLSAPRHDYTRELLAAVPRLDGPAPAPPEGTAAPIIEARGLVREFPPTVRGAAPLRAVDDVDLTLYPGQALGLVGESGSGKTTLARILVGLDTGFRGRLDRPPGRGVQYVFQDPYSALNPRHSVARIIAEPIELSGTREQRKSAQQTVRRLLDDVQLPRDYADRRPHELSGGQRQRVVIARALALSPTVLIADEPVSALDLSVQAGILDLLARLRVQQNLTYLVISHDLAVIRQLCSDVLVMRDGAVVERGTTEEIFAAARDPYTRLLLDSIPGRAWREKTP